MVISIVRLLDIHVQAQAQTNGNISSVIGDIHSEAQVV